MAEKPMTRLQGKSDPEKVKTKNDKVMNDFWASLQGDLESHSQALAEHSKKAAKLAETIKTVKVTKKVAGRTVPNSTHYVQTITKKSDQPFKKD
jgi:hypothetical protein